MVVNIIIRILMPVIFIIYLAKNHGIRVLLQYQDLLDSAFYLLDSVMILNFYYEVLVYSP